MSDDFVQAGLFVAIGTAMAVFGSIMLKRTPRAERGFEAKTAFFLFAAVVGLVLAVVGLGILSLVWSTDL